MGVALRRALFLINSFRFRLVFYSLSLSVFFYFLFVSLFLPSLSLINYNNNNYNHNNNHNNNTIKKPTLFDSKFSATSQGLLDSDGCLLECSFGGSRCPSSCLHKLFDEQFGHSVVSPLSSPFSLSKASLSHDRSSVTAVVITLTKSLSPSGDLGAMLKSLVSNFLVHYPQYPLLVFHENNYQAHEIDRKSGEPYDWLHLKGLIHIAAGGRDLPIRRVPIPSLQGSTSPFCSKRELEKKIKNEKNETLRRFGLGYRNMARQFAGPLFWREEFADVDYYLRVDTDSRIESKVLVDPFKLMRNNNCKYAYNYMQRDQEFAVIGLYTTFLNWLATYKQREFEVVPNLEKSVRRVIEYLSKRETLENNNNKNKSNEDEESQERLVKPLEYSRLMYYNNFEAVSLKVVRSQLNVDLFNFLDRDCQLLARRWGDAPIRTLLVNLLLDRDKQEVCKLPKKLFPYTHPFSEGESLL